MSAEAWRRRGGRPKVAPTRCEPSLRAQRSNPDTVGLCAGLLRRDTPRNDGVLLWSGISAIAEGQASAGRATKSRPYEV